MSDPITPALICKLWKRCPGRAKVIAVMSGLATVIVLSVTTFIGGLAALPIGMVAMVGIVMAMAKEIERIRPELNREMAKDRNNDRE